jgi:hypothetical protein
LFQETLEDPGGRKTQCAIIVRIPAKLHQPEEADPSVVSNAKHASKAPVVDLSAVLLMVLPTVEVSGHLEIP